jgi:hypothetical protein
MNLWKKDLNTMIDSPTETLEIRAPGLPMMQQTPFPLGEEWNSMKNQAALLVKSGFLPKAVNTAEKAIAIMLKSRELGIGPMEGLSGISIIEGKPSVSPEMMLKLIFRAYPNTKLEYLINTGEECKIQVTRPGQKPQVFSFTLNDAKTAGLTGKYNWKNYPRAMLRSRCVAEMARSLFPDAIAGCSYTPDELGADTSSHDVKTSGRREVAK